jgi:predicted nucleic acid-binding Zn ribbon protein
MAKRNYPVERLGAVLEESLKRLDLAPQLEAYGIWPVWDDVVGPPVARNAQPEKIRHGTLFVKVSSPVWMQQLQFMKELIAEKLNERLRAHVVKNIFFIVGTVAPAGADAKESARPRARIDNEVKPTAAFLEQIEDVDLRNAFAALLRGYSRRSKNADR